MIFPRNIRHKTTCWPSERSTQITNAYREIRTIYDYLFGMILMGNRAITHPMSPPHQSGFLVLPEVPTGLCYQCIVGCILNVTGCL